MRHLLQNTPSRGIGGEPKRSGSKTAGKANSPPRQNPHDCGQTDKREAFARRAAVPSGGNAVNITEAVRKYAAEQAISEEEALQRGMEEKSKEFVESGAEVYAKAWLLTASCRRNYSRSILSNGLSTSLNTPDSRPDFQRSD